MTRIRAGVAKVLIDIRSLLPYQGYGSILDSLFVRSLYISANQQQLFISIDVTSLKDSDIEEIKKKIRGRYGIENMWIMVTHNFNSIHTRSTEALSQANEETVSKNKRFLEILMNAIILSVNESLSRLQEVSFGFQSGFCDINCSRHSIGESDKGVDIIKIEDADKKLKAVLYNYSLQSSFMEDYRTSLQEKIISADIVGDVSACIEKENCGSVAMFFLGAGGDQVPKKKISQNVDLDGTVYQQLSLVSQPLCTEIKRRLKNIVCDHESSELLCEEISIDLVAKDNGGQLPVLLSFIALGPMVFVGLKPELTAILGKRIKQQSHSVFTMVTTMVNGGCKYLPNNDSYDLETYESKRTYFERGSGEILEKYIINKINEIRY